MTSLVKASILVLSCFLYANVSMGADAGTDKSVGENTDTATSNSAPASNKLDSKGVIKPAATIKKTGSEASLTPEKPPTQTTPGQKTPTQKTPTQTTAENVCAACHGANGNSAISLNPKLAGQHPEYLLKQLTNFKAGIRANAVMTGIASTLTLDEMQNLSKYYADQTQTSAKAKKNGAKSLGESIYRGGIAANQVPACASCHGATGAGIPKQFPRLAGQHADYTYEQLKKFRTGERANAPMMMQIAAKMTDAQMQAVSDYMQGLR